MEREGEREEEGGGGEVSDGAGYLVLEGSKVSLQPLVFPLQSLHAGQVPAIVI